MLSPISIDELAGDPHATLAALRSSQPVAWLDEISGWLVTSHAFTTSVLRDSATFTVDDDRFSTRRVVGPSMLALDGPAHGRHRSAFAPDYRKRHVHDRLEGDVRDLASSLVARIGPEGGGDLRTEVARPLAAEVMRRMLGLDDVDVAALNRWNTSIIDAIDVVTGGGEVPSDGTAAFGELTEAVAIGLDGAGSLKEVADRSDLTLDEVAANVAVLLIGGIVTADGTISILFRHLLDRPRLIDAIRDDPRLIDRVIDESMRLEPAAAFLDRYATSDTVLGSASIRKGDLVRVSISGANRDPDVFDGPDEFDLTRSNSSEHLSFARGPHACLGIHVARLETRIAILAVIEGLSGLRADPTSRHPVRGLIFRSPDEVRAIWVATQ